MPDIAEDNWAERDDLNAENAPDGFPPGLPASIEKIGQMMMGAIKRSWRRANPFYQTTGTADAYVVSPESAPNAINIYEMISFRVDRTNTTTSPTLKFGVTNARSIKKIGASGKVSVAVGDIIAGMAHSVWYDGTDYILTNPAIADSSLSSGLLKVANNLNDVASVPAARTNLGLGTAAVQNVTYFATAAQGALADTAAQKSANLSDLASLTTAKSNLGLGNVDNTSDANKPVSTAQQTALNLKANLASPNFTGSPTAPTPTVGDNSTLIATTAFVAANTFVGTSLVTYTPTFTGFGTVTVSSFFWRREGDMMFIEGTFTCGTSTAVEARISLPSTYTVDSTKNPSIRHVGDVARGAASTNLYVALAESGVGYITFGISSSTLSPLTKQTGNNLFNSGEIISVRARVPITGW